MKAQEKTHPSHRQLAAFALGKLAPDSRTALKRHLSDCADCARFVADTPRDSLIGLLKHNTARTAAEQSTPGIRDGETLAGARGAASAPRSLSPQPEPRPSQAAHDSDAADHGGDARIPQALLEQTKYQIRRLLGRGGMGSVYEAYHELMDRQVAIKVINPSLVENPEALRRFDQEVKAAARLDHPNVARAYDASELGSTRILVMEFVPGQSLDKRLAEKGRLSVIESCRLIRQAMAGLQQACDRNMVHRDLKPQNLMLTPDGRVKILDFGLAKVASERCGAAGLTRDNALMGTPHYLAPEQALDAAKADIRADIYSLGCTLYCLLTGSPPFDADTEMKILMAHQNDAPRPLTEVRPDVPAGLSQLVDRMLAKNPVDRPQTPAEVARELAPYTKPLEAAPVQAPATALGVLDISMDAGPAIRRNARRPAWTKQLARPRVLIGGGISFLALVLLGALAAGILQIRTPTGTIIIENAPAAADVTVDGRRITVARAGGLLTIDEIPGGEHQLKLTIRDQVVWSADVTVDVAGSPVRVRYKPNRSSIETVAGVVESEIPVEQPDQIEQPAQAQYAHRDATVTSGRWEIVGDEIRQTSADLTRGFLFFGDPTWSNYNLTLQAKTAAGSHGFQVCFHVRGPQVQSLFEGGAHENQNHLLASRTGPNGRQGRRRTVSGKIIHNQWYNVRVEVRGSACRCYLDNELVFDEDIRGMVQGRIGLGSVQGTTVAFRDIKLTSENGDAIYWEGLPNLPGKSTAATADSNEVDPSPADVYDGSWRVEGDELVQGVECQEIVGLVFGNPSWSRYNLDLDVRMIHPDYLFVAYHFLDRDSYRLFTLSGDGNSWHDANMILSGQWAERKRQKKPGSLAAAEWRHLRIEVRGSEAAVFLDSVKLFDYSDERITAGRIGLGSKFAASFKNMVVTSEDGSETLWKGPPKLPIEPGPDAPAPNDDGADAASRRAGDALFVPGSVWTGTRSYRKGGYAGKTVMYELHVEGRGDKQFTGHAFDNGRGRNRAAVEGEFTETGITWRERFVHDPRIVTTVEATFGMDGQKLGIQFHRQYPNGATTEGDATLTLPSSPTTKARDAQDNSARALDGQVISGAWSTDGDELVQSSTGYWHATLVFGDSSWSHYNLEFKAKALTGNDGFTALFHYRDEDNRRHSGFGARGGYEHVLGCRFNGEWNPGDRRVANSGTVELDRWYAVRLEVRGESCKAFLDGQEVVDGADDRFTAGSIGLSTIGSTARFRDIVVTSVDGQTVLWKGIPSIAAPDAGSSSSTTGAKPRLSIAAVNEHILVRHALLLLVPTPSFPEFPA